MKSRNDPYATYWRDGIGYWFGPPEESMGYDDRKQCPACGGLGTGGCVSVAELLDGSAPDDGPCPTCGGTGIAPLVDVDHEYILFDGRATDEEGCMAASVYEVFRAPSDEEAVKQAEKGWAGYNWALWRGNILVKYNTPEIQ